MHRNLFAAQMAQYATPTVAGEDSIICEDGIKCYLPYLEVQGNTEQKTYGGYNLFDINTPLLVAKSANDLNYYSPKIENGVIHSGGKLAVTEGAYICIKTDGKSVYNISFNADFDEATQTTRYYRLVYFNDFTNGVFNSPTYSGYTAINKGKHSFKISSDGYNYIGFASFSDAQYGMTFTNLQIEKGTVATPYESYVGGIASPNPEYSQEIKNCNNAILPSEYQQVEYIESTGTQIINTVFKPTDNTKVLLDMKMTNLISDGTGIGNAICGCYDETNVFSINFGTSTGQATILFCWVNSRSVNGGTYTNLNVYDTVSSRNTLFLTNNSISYGKYTTTLTKGSWSSLTESLRLFGHLNSSGVEIPFERYHIVLYGAKIYDKSNLVRNYIPCYRKSDNVIGLYDLVNDVFYTNKGTGEFIKGADIVGGATSVTLKSPNIFNKAEFSSEALRNETEFKGHGMSVITTDKINLMLKPSTKYAVSYEVEGITDIPEGATVATGQGFLFVSFLNGENYLWARSSKLAKKGEKFTYTTTISTPENLYERAYKLYIYSGRYTLEDTTTAVSCIIRNVQLVELPNLFNLSNTLTDVNFYKTTYNDTDCINVSPTTINHIFNLSKPIPKGSNVALTFNVAFPVGSDFYIIAKYADGTTGNLYGRTSSTALTDFTAVSRTLIAKDDIVALDFRTYSIATYKQNYFKNFYLYVNDAKPYYTYFEPHIISIPNEITVNGTIVPLRFARLSTVNNGKNIINKADTLSIDRIANKVIYTQYLDLIRPIKADSLYTSYGTRKGVYFLGLMKQKGLRRNGICTHSRLVGDYYTENSWWLGVESTAVYWYDILDLLGISDWADGEYPTEEQKAKALEDFNLWLANQIANGTPVEVLYELPTPIKYDLTDTDLGQELLNSIIQENGTTLITVSNANELTQKITAKYLTHA